MIELLKRFFFDYPPPPPKDPSDNRKSESSTYWEQDYYCRSCLSSQDHNELMTRLCSSCGSRTAGVLSPTRAVRKIFDGKNWVTQRKYNDDSWDIVG